MKTTGNTILITGGASGIGLALAEEFKKLGNEVIVAGRSHAKLEMAKSKGLQVMTVDMTDETSIKKLATDAIHQWPSLNYVIHNAGIMVNEKVTTSDTSKIAEDTVMTNFLGPIRLTNYLLPHLLKQNSATVMMVTSGLAFAPLAMTPTYSATKAAIHSYTQSLRLQLKGTSVQVKELVPPYVQTTLMGDRQASDPNAMPLKEFINEVMTILKSSPEAEEILVERVKPQRTSSYQGAEHYKNFFQSMNDRLMTARKQEWDKL
jgi:uncharacterized oxidoreductase